MGSLLQQIQREALDASTRVPDLLRKVKVAAVKLKRSDAVAWVGHELTGYVRGTQMPDYRKLTGTPQFLNPVRGWCPLLVEDAELRRMMSTHDVTQPVSEIESLVRLSKGGGDFRVDYPPALIQDIEKTVGFEIGGAGIRIGTNQLEGILDSVRTRVVEWALEMEKAGVQGEDDISFSKEDVKAAAGVTYNITIGGSVTGNIGPVSGHGRVDATSIGADTTAALRTLAEQITKRAGELNVPPEKREEIIGQAADLRNELAQSAPNTGRIGHILASIRSIAEIAAGDLVAAGILHVLSRPEVAALIERGLGS